MQALSHQLQNYVLRNLPLITRSHAYRELAPEQQSLLTDAARNGVQVRGSSASWLRLCASQQLTSGLDICTAGLGGSRAADIMKMCMNNQLGGGVGLNGFVLGE